MNKDRFQQATKDAKVLALKKLFDAKKEIVADSVLMTQRARLATKI